MIRRLPVSLLSPSSRPVSTTAPGTPQTAASALRLASGESEFTSAPSARRVALEVPQSQARAPRGTRAFRVPAGISEDRPVSIPNEAGIDRLRRTPVPEHIVEANQDPVARLRFALLRARFDRALELPQQHHCCDKH